MSEAKISPRITPFLWFDANAEEAVDFYCTVFPDARRVGDMRGPDGRVFTLTFELQGLRFTALNGGPMFRFTEAFSLMVTCDSQEEIDGYWKKLTSGGGEESRCGWLKDKFGLSWQIVPARLPELLSRPGAMRAMMGMKKLDIAELERAGQP